MQRVWARIPRCLEFFSLEIFLNYSSAGSLATVFCFFPLDVDVTIIIQPPETIQIRGFRSLSILCSATGRFVDDFKFFHNDRVLTDDDNTNVTITEDISGGLPVVTATLTLYSVGPEDVGEYGCVAGNALAFDFATFNIELLGMNYYYPCQVKDNDYLLR